MPNNSTICTHDNYSSKLEKMSKFLLNPIFENPIFFLFQTIILSAPAWTFWITQFTTYYRLYTILATPCTIFAAYLCTVIVHNIPKSKSALYFMSYLFSILEIFLILNFGTRFSHSIFQLLIETTPNEAKDFIASYIATTNVFIYSIIVAFFISINIIAERYKSLQIIIKEFISSIPNKPKTLIAYILILFGIIYAYRDIRFTKYIIFSDFEEVKSKLQNCTYGDNYTTFGKVNYSLYSYYSTSNETEVLVETLSKTSNIESTFSSKNIILILGESFNKYHSSLYGYCLETNPLLKREDNNLYIMTDVISPHNGTAKCMRKLFSFANQDNNLYWAKTPLFPALYKSAGYNVLFFSNQEVSSHEVHNDWDLINNFMISLSTKPYLYHATNSEIHQYDAQLIDEFNVYYKNNHSGQPKLVIFHLLGQHVGYVERCPKSDVTFSKDHYQHRTELDIKQKEIVAHYDNATFYNDKVVSSIIDIYRDEDAIIIYLSDHGDEVYDYRNHFGRSHESIISKGRAMSQYEVPFMIWVSDKYKETHPDIIKRINDSVDRPFMTDDLPHLMLDLAGIKCDWFEPSRSLINGQYNVNRKRLLEDSKQNYDEIMKSPNLN